MPARMNQPNEIPNEHTEMADPSLFSLIHNRASQQISWPEETPKLTVSGADHRYCCLHPRHIGTLDRYTWDGMNESYKIFSNAHKAFTYVNPQIAITHFDQNWEFWFTIRHSNGKPFPKNKAKINNIHF